MNHIVTSRVLAILGLVVCLGAVPAWAQTEISSVTFRAGKTPIATKIRSVRVTPDTAQMETTYLADGSCRLVIIGNGDSEGTVTLDITPADRITYVQGEHTVARKLPAVGKLELRTTALVCQSRKTQQGLQISLQRGAFTKPIAVQPAGGSVTVSIPFNGPTMSLLVHGITGDASIALEDAPVFAGTIAAATAPSGKQSAATATGQPVQDITPEEPESTVGEWQWFSGKRRAFAPMLADPEETVTHLGYMFDENSGKLADFGIGGDIVILNFSPDEDSLLTFSIRGLLTGRLDGSLDSNPIVDADYIGGLAVGYETGPWEFEAYFYHESSHLGDEMITKYNVRRIDYSKEVLRFLAARRFFDDSLRVYGGVSFIVNGTPNELDTTFEFQVGAEYTFDLWDIPMFAAVDLQTQQANNWYLNTNAQYGIFLNRSVNRPRIYLEFYHGYSNMGQFWNQKETHGMIGFGYDF
jgi:hypothetical protein